MINKSLFFCVFVFLDVLRKKRHQMMRQTVIQQFPPAKEFLKGYCGIFCGLSAFVSVLACMAYPFVRIFHIRCKLSWSLRFCQRHRRIRYMSNYHHHKYHRRPFYVLNNRSMVVYSVLHIHDVSKQGTLPHHI